MGACVARRCLVKNYCEPEKFSMQCSSSSTLLNHSILVRFSYDCYGDSRARSHRRYTILGIHINNAKPRASTTGCHVTFHVFQLTSTSTTCFYIRSFILIFSCPSLNMDFITHTLFPRLSHPPTVLALAVFSFSTVALFTSFYRDNRIPLVIESNEADSKRSSEHNSDGTVNEKPEKAIDITEIVSTLSCYSRSLLGFQNRKSLKKDILSDLSLEISQLIAMLCQIQQQEHSLNDKPSLKLCVDSILTGLATACYAADNEKCNDLEDRFHETLTQLQSYRPTIAFVIDQLKGYIFPSLYCSFARKHLTCAELNQAFTLAKRRIKPFQRKSLKRALNPGQTLHRKRSNYLHTAHLSSKRSMKLKKYYLVTARSSRNSTSLFLQLISRKLGYC